MKPPHIVPHSQMPLQSDVSTAFFISKRLYHCVRIWYQNLMSRKTSQHIFLMSNILACHKTNFHVHSWLGNLFTKGCYNEVNKQMLLTLVLKDLPQVSGQRACGLKGYLFIDHCDLGTGQVKSHTNQYVYQWLHLDVILTLSWGSESVYIRTKDVAYSFTRGQKGYEVKHFKYSGSISNGCKYGSWIGEESLSIWLP